MILWELEETAAAGQRGSNISAINRPVNILLCKLPQTFDK